MGSVYRHLKQVQPPHPDPLPQGEREIHLADARSSSSSSTASLRARFGRTGFDSTTFGLTVARSRIGFRYWPVAETGTAAMASGVPSAMIRPPLTPPPGP